MAFMRPEITEKQEWAAVETNSGTWWVPFDVLSKSEAARAKGGDFEPLLQYTEGTRVYNDQSSIKKGYGVRLSAPGYMDATDWEVYGNLKEAQRRERELIEEDEGDHATKRKPKKSSHATAKTSARSSISARKIDNRWQPVSSGGHVVRGDIYNADGTGYSTREGAVEAAAMLRQLAKKH